ncbi:MAG TPA: serine/threonine-protein kinase, partial [Polyangiaceae bacterium]|nr:serine/threonine-protein kinase [Polyangiaceae bacterium]
MPDFSDGTAAVAGERTLGARIGRYEIRERIGAGGMGTVLRAHDPELGRDVALKLLHAGYADASTRAEASQQLVREARVLARLSHPNVVAAYDVGVTDAGAVFLAMELVDGVSLGEWLKEPRSTREVARVLIAAGRGLAAAHASGVLHRDFKPANVMVSPDSRVRVIDFGLARAAGSGTLDAPAGAAPRSSGSGPRAPRGSLPPVTHTRVSAGVGTPGYISPEQLLGQSIDTRSDQFGYAVTAFVALTGHHPYPDSVNVAGSPRADDEAPAVLTATRQPWPPSVPRPLRRVIDRGLSLDPEERYPSLAALVNALERASTRRGRVALPLALAGALVLGVTLVGAWARPGADPAVCAVDAAAFDGVWDTAQREHIEAVFRATGHQSSGDVFGLVSRRLDRFEQQWLAMRRESCEATLVRGDQPERVMALRAACLDRAREATKALVAVLGQTDRAAMDRTASAAPASLAVCSDPAALLSVAAALPDDPAKRAQIDEVSVGIAVDRALITASRGPEALEQAQRMLELARATEHPPTIAAATAQLGRAYNRLPSPTESARGEALLNESIRLAALAGDDRLVAATSSFLLFRIAYGQTRIQEAEAMLPAVEALVHRAGDRVEDRLNLLMGRYAILFRHDQMEEGAQVLDEVVRLAENAEDEFKRHGVIAAAEMGHVYTELGRFEQAEVIEQRAADGMRRLFGANHPQMMTALGNLSIVQSKAGHRDRALQSIAEYQRIAALMPPDEPRLKYLEFAESRVWRITGDCARALPLL